MYVKHALVHKITCFHTSEHGLYWLLPMLLLHQSVKILSRGAYVLVNDACGKPRGKERVDCRTKWQRNDVRFRARFRCICHHLPTIFWRNENKMAKIITATEFSLWNNSNPFFCCFLLIHSFGPVIFIRIFFSLVKMRNFNAIIQCFSGGVRNGRVLTQYILFVLVAVATIMSRAFFRIFYCIGWHICLFGHCCWIFHLRSRWSVSNNDGTATKLIDLCG